MEKYIKIQMALLAILIVLQIMTLSTLRSSGTFLGSSGSSQQEPLFVDNRGEIIDPYVRRQVKNTITANAKDIQNCYNEYVSRNPNSEGKGSVSMDWTTLPSGKAINARIVFSELSEDQFHSCLTSSIERWSFPPPRNEVYAEHRFNFSKVKTEPPL